MSPLLEHFQFIPYEGQSEIDSSDSNVLNDYINRCNQMAVRLAKKYNFRCNDFTAFDKNIENLVQSGKTDNLDEGVEDESDEHSLLKALNDIESTKFNAKNAKNEIISNLDKDVLNQHFCGEYFIRPLIETVVENLDNFSKKVNVLEVTQSSAFIAETVIQTLRSLLTAVDINYSLLHPMAEQLSGKSPYDIDGHNWDVLSSRIPSSLNNLDLIVFEDRIDWMSSETNIDLSTVLSSLWNALKNNGFLIVIHKNQLNFAEEVFARLLSDQNNNWLTSGHLTKRKDQIIFEAQRFGFTLIAKKSDAISKSSLIFRKLDPEIRIERQTFIRITNDSCEHWIEKLQDSFKTIADRPNTENIWLIGNDSTTNGIVGLANCLRKEPNGNRIRCLFDYDFEKNNILDTLQKEDIFKTIVKKDLFMNVLTADKILGAFRRFSIDSNKNMVPSEHSYLNVQTRGDLSSFKWFEAQHKYWPLGKTERQRLIKIYYSAMNFKDVMLATGTKSYALAEISISYHFAQVNYLWTNPMKVYSDQSIPVLMRVGVE